MIEDSHPHFIPDDHAGRRGLTAVLLTGTAREFGLDQRNVRSTRGGFYITPALLDALGDDEVLSLVPDDEGDLTGVSVTPLPEDIDEDEDDEVPDYDPSDYSIDDVKATVEEDPYTDTVEYIVEKEKAGKARKTLLTWLAEFEASERPTGA